MSTSAEAPNPLVYKIRYPSGMFSSGGLPPYPKRIGRVWRSRGALSAHFTLLAETGFTYPEGTEIVMVEEVVRGAKPASVYHADADARVAARHEREAARRRERTEARERAQLRALKEKYE